MLQPSQLALRFIVLIARYPVQSVPSTWSQLCGALEGDTLWPVRYHSAVKRNSEHRELNPDDPRLQEWETIFRGAEAGRFPNNVLGVLEMAECLREFRRSRIVPNSSPPPR
jgi:hypothetical protein